MGGFLFFKSASVCGFGAVPLEGVRGDELGDLLDVGGAGELEDHGAQTGEHQLQLAVQVEVAGGLDGEGLNLAVGQGGEVLLLAGEPLDVDGDHPLVGEHHIVPHGGVGAHHLLAGGEELQNVFLLGVLVQTELDNGFVGEVDHGDSSSAREPKATPVFSKYESMPPIIASMTSSLGVIFHASSTRVRETSTVFVTEVS